MATELELQEALADVLRSMTYFEDNDVSINDWGVLDDEKVKAPFAIVQTADDFESTDTYADTTRFVLVAYVFIEFVDWQTSLNEMRDVRQNVLTTMNTGSNRALSIDSVRVERIFALSGVEPYYDPTLESSQIPYADPLYLFQATGFDTTQY